MNRPDFDYYYENESEQFNFYRIPKLLFTDKKFKKISCEAKVLYGLMLDRMGLSMKNNWLDANKRVFIIFTLEDAMEMLNCGKDKGVELFKELDEKGGLIERKKQGQGKPAIIYVKNFIQSKTGNQAGSKNFRGGFPSDDTLMSKGKNQADMKRADFGFSEVKASEIPKSALLEIRTQDFGKTDPNYNNINNTELNDIKNQSFNHENRAKRYDFYKQIFYENIEYEYLIMDWGKERVDHAVSILLDACFCEKSWLKVSQSKLPKDVVISQLLKIDKFHMDYVFDCMDKNTTKITNIKAYLLSAFYNAVTTMDQHISSMVRNNLYGDEL